MTESVPVKLSQPRARMHAIGLVTDVGFFLERLAAEFCERPGLAPARSGRQAGVRAAGPGGGQSQKC